MNSKPKLKPYSGVFLLLAWQLVSMDLCAEDEIVTFWETSSGEKMQTTVENTWTSDAITIVEKVYTGAWAFSNLKSGDSTMIRLYRSDASFETDAGGSHEIVFQLPMAVHEGQTFQLRPVPVFRYSKKSEKDKRIAEMKDGEITAFRYRNPLMGWMKHKKEASVKIVSLTETEAVIHLKFRAKLDPHWDFDLDEQFTVKVASPPKR